MVVGGRLSSAPLGPARPGPALQGCCSLTAGATISRTGAVRLRQGVPAGCCPAAERGREAGKEAGEEAERPGRRQGGWQEGGSPGLRTAALPGSALGSGSDPVPGAPSCPALGIFYVTAPQSPRSQRAGLDLPQGGKGKLFFFPPPFSLLSLPPPLNAKQSSGGRLAEPPSLY